MELIEKLQENGFADKVANELGICHKLFPVTEEKSAEADMELFRHMLMKEIDDNQDEYVPIMFEDLLNTCFDIYSEKLFELMEIKPNMDAEITELDRVAAATAILIGGLL